MQESSGHVSKATDGVIFVLGAGVDRVLGLPLLNTLFRDLGEFARGPGKGINKAIRSHAKPLPLDLETYGGDQAETLGQKLLGTHPHLLPDILKALDKHRDAANPRVKTIKALMKKLAVIASENELNEAMMSELSKLAGQADSSATDTLLDPTHIAFRPKARDAIKAVFTQVQDEIPNLTPEERNAFGEVIALLSNFEELMADLFTGYFTKHIPDQKKYFYLAWLLWAYIRHKEEGARTKRAMSFYKTLSDIGVRGENIVTFNYTDFFDERTRPQNGYFHGDCKGFIRFRTRDYVTNDIQARNATTLPLMAAFIEGLKVDWKKTPPAVSLPAIVPPLAMKPIICTEYLDRWYQCGQTIMKAKTIVIIGYSFSVADEHFNDLIRKGQKDARLIVVDPDIESVVNRVCQTLDHKEAGLRAATIQDLECKIDARLTFVRAKAEHIDSNRLNAILEAVRRKPSPV
jgi:hypothetical protein